MGDVNYLHHVASTIHCLTIKMEVSMSLVRTNGDLTPRLPALFNDFFNRDLFAWNLSNFFNAGTALPSVNIWETGDAFEVEMAAPGMRKQDFKVQLNGNTLSISSERQEEETLNGRNYTRDRKSTRLNSSHVKISYAVFCLKK